MHDSHVFTQRTITAECTWLSHATVLWFWIHMCILANPSAQCKQTSIIVLRLSCRGNTNGSGFYTFSILGRHQVFLLYALELDNFCDIAHGDCPAYNLVTDFIQLLKYLNIN